MTCKTKVSCEDLKDGRDRMSELANIGGLVREASTLAGHYGYSATQKHLEKTAVFIENPNGTAPPEELLSWAHRLQGKRRPNWGLIVATAFVNFFMILGVLGACIILRTEGLAVPAWILAGFCLFVTAAQWTTIPKWGYRNGRG